MSAAPKPDLAVTLHPPPDAPMAGDVVIRPALVGDVPAIADLIARFAREALLLPRPAEEVYEVLDEFGVCLRDDVLVGCTALHVYGPHLAEVRSVAVREGCQRHGIGARLVEWSVAQAGERGVARVFTLTYRARFFERLGFVRVDRQALPEKIWGDCARCPKADFCDEIALVRHVGPPGGA